MIQTKSVHSPAESSDGLRVLVSRFRGRGLPKSCCDVWMPNLGPSESLLRNVLDGKISWREFEKRYRAEILEESPVDRHNRTIKNHGQKFTLRLLQALASRGTVTLMCQCPEDAEQCHRYTLAKMIEKA